MPGLLLESAEQTETLLSHEALKIKAVKSKRDKILPSGAAIDETEATGATAGQIPLCSPSLSSLQSQYSEHLFLQQRALPQSLRD